MFGSKRPRGEERSQQGIKRSRVLVACQRCKTRRQKCDNAIPVCSNCARAQLDACAYAEDVYPSSYVRMLEERLANLEARSQQFDATQPADNSQESFGTIASTRGISTLPHAPEMTARDSSSRLVVGLGVLSSCAAAEPHYFGYSSGLSLAHFVQAAIDGGNNAEISLPSLSDRPFSSQIPTSKTPYAPLPSKSRGSQYIKAYLCTIHPLYPFLDRNELWRISQDAAKLEREGTTASSLDLVLLHLVYAIGSRCLQLLNYSNVGKHTPEEHCVSAMKNISEVLKFTSVRSIEITLLLALHSLRSPSGASVWHLCGLAVRQCLELGLHKQKQTEKQYLLLDQQRKRLFWSVYIFERKTALVLGRPFAVADEEIDVDLPLNVNDDEHNTRALSAAKQGESTDDASSEMISTLSLHRHHVMLYHVHTRIRFTLHRLKNAGTFDAASTEIIARFKELEDWKDAVLLQYANKSLFPRFGSTPPRSDSPDSSSDADSKIQVPFQNRSVETEKIELCLEYQKARRALLQSLMTEARSQYEFKASDYLACADASGQICQLYRRLHRLSPTAFNLRDLHAVFVAGFTLLYCLCVKPSLYDAQRAGDIGACSTVLYVIAEQWASAKRYRDAFELVAERVVNFTQKSFEDSTEEAILRSRHVDVAQVSSGQRTSADVDSQENIAQESKAKVPSQFRPSTDRPLQDQDGRVDAGEDDQSDEQTAHTDAEGYASNTANPGAASNPPLFSFDSGFSDEIDEIAGLLASEGMDWFTDAGVENAGWSW